jgi:hypothetical protein
VLSAGVPLLGSSGFDYVYIPVVSTLGVVLLGLVLRWSHSRTPRGSRVADPSQGLLIGVAAAAPAEAERIRQLLTEAGLRTTSRQVGSRQQVLVWPDDVDTALRVLSEHR